MSIVSSFGITAIERWAERGERERGLRRTPAAGAGARMIPDLLAALRPEAPRGAARHARARRRSRSCSARCSPSRSPRRGCRRTASSAARLRLRLFLPRHAAARAALPRSTTAPGSSRPQLKAIGLWGFFRDAFNCALLTFSLNTAAYQAEIYRGAIRSVPQGPMGGGARARAAPAAASSGRSSCRRRRSWRCGRSATRSS